MGNVVTRFAPSPTGYLHIGGARTALFNWLYARHHGGRFLLRIEDTDRARSTPEATQAILDGLAWLGLDHDEAAVYQSERQQRHVEVANELLARNLAYKDDGAVRIRGRRAADARLIIDDKVQGRVTFAGDQLDDFVILRSDGTPTYMLAVVVDDHDMGVNTVIRGVDHLTNAARQRIIYHHMGWEVPTYAHIPLIHGPDGAKLSKRHGALGIDYYQSQGFTAPALRNYLARLGWSHGDDELFDTEQAIEWFSDLSQINKAPARLDFDKMRAVNQHHMQRIPDAKLFDLLNVPPHPGLATILPHIKPRCKTLNEVRNMLGFLYQAPEPRPEIVDPDNFLREVVWMLRDYNYSRQAWVANNLEDEFRYLATKTIPGMINKPVRLGEVIAPVRLALTGQPVSPPIFEVMVALGRDETMKRLSHG